MSHSGRLARLLMTGSNKGLNGPSLSSHRTQLVRLSTTSQKYESKVRIADLKSALEGVSDQIDPVKRLQLYGLYQQATRGTNPEVRPSVDPELLAKWDAWYEMKGLSKEEAEEQYLMTAKVIETCTCEGLSIEKPSVQRCRTS